jgi:hypothetical protein
VNEANNPFAPLGLPANFAPAPPAWRLGKLDMAGPAGNVELHVVVFDTPAGRFAVTFDAAGARQLAEALTTQASGLTLARTLPANNGGGTT